MSLSTSYSWLNKNILLFSCLFGLVSFAILLIVKSTASLSYLNDISGSETSTILPIQLLINGDPIYTNPENAPFRLIQYTPIYFYIVAFFYKLTDWTAFDVHKVFLSSRAFSMIFTLLGSALAGYSVFLVSNRNKIVSILSALYIYHILALWLLTGSRPDSLLILLTSSLLLVVYTASKSDATTQNWWYLAIFIAVSAFFVKQSGAVHSLAIGAYFMATRQWKMLLRVTLAGVAFFCFYLLILPINTIPLFFTNIIGGVANSISFDWFYGWTLERWVMQFAVLMVLNIMISTYHFAKRPTPFSLFLAVSSPLFFLFATLTSLKIGAGVGYYQDYLILAVVQIAAFFTDKKESSRLGGELGRIGISLYLLFVYFYSALFVFMTYRNVLFSDQSASYIEQRQVAEYLITEKGLGKEDWISVESEISSDYFIRHFLYQQTLTPFKDLVYLADKNKTFDFSEFRGMVDKGQIHYVITDHGSSPKNILNYSYGNTLKLSSTIGPYDIYESKILQNIEL
jgi:hypothetical protein